MTQGILFLVSTPIGNPKDISERALEILQSTEHVFCEERKAGYQLLASYKIRKELECINEHNEKEQLSEIWKILQSGKNVAYFSDCGTPVLADPGYAVVQYVRKKGGTVQAIPGVSSIMTALSLSPFPIQRFFYYGFLSQERVQRQKELKELRSFPYTIVLLETPYRLQRLLQELETSIHPAKHMCLCLNLTHANEQIIYGDIKKVAGQVKDLGKTNEFVILLSPPK